MSERVTGGCGELGHIWIWDSQNKPHGYKDNNDSENEEEDDYVDDDYEEPFEEEYEDENDKHWM